VRWVRGRWQRCCLSPGLWVIPAAWRIVLAGGTTIVIRNADPGNRGLPPTGGLITCQGRLGAEPQPSYMTP
jgi:hypothetical protein